MVSLLSHYCVAQVKNNSKPTTYALIMGISQYKYLPRLHFADNDAIFFRDLLISNADNNLDSTSIFCLVNEYAKKDTIFNDAMRWLDTRKYKKGDILYIYLAGHVDAMNEDEAFFLPVDCNPEKDGDKKNYMLGSALSLNDLNSKIAGIRARGAEVVLIMDVCRPADLPGGDKGRKKFVSGFLKNPAGEMIILSAGQGKTAIEGSDIGSGHGLLTWYVVGGLAGGADNNKDGSVTFSELSNYVKFNVDKKARNRYKMEQMPVFCCRESDGKVIGKVNSSFFERWSGSEY
jgi:hypothetical protein